MYGYLLAGGPPIDLTRPCLVRTRVLWSTMSRTRMAEGIRRLRDAGDTETMKGPTQKAVCCR